MRKKILAVGSALLLVAGLISLGAGPANAGGAGTNDETTWQTLPNETCIKIEPVTVVPYLLPALKTGQSYSKVIVKAGSTGSSVTNENTIYVVSGAEQYPGQIVGPLAPGTPVKHAEKDSISHIILCTVPTPPTDVCSNIDGVQSEVPAGMVADGTHCAVPPTDVRNAVAGAVTTTAATCNAAQTLVLGAGTHATWGEVTYSGEGNLHYTVTATAADGHAFVDGSTTFVVTGTLAAALTSEQCYQEPPTVVRDAVAGAVTTKAATCDAAQTLVLGVGTHATWGAVTYSGEANLHYSVTATAGEGHTFENGQTTVTVTGTLSPKLNGSDCLPFEPPTLGLVTPVVASTNISCKADGSYTLGEANGVNDAIVWTVNGTVAEPGTYKVKSAGTVHVTAVPNGIEHAFESGIDNPSTWTLSFTAAQACGDLTTLALPGDNTLAATGADSGTVNFGLLFAGGLLLLGGALLVADRKFRYGK